MTPTNGEMNRKSEKVRRANRTIQNRTLILMAFLGVGVFIWVFDAVAVLAVKTLVSLFAA